MGTDSLSSIIDYPQPKKSRPSVEHYTYSCWNYLPSVILHEVFLYLETADRTNASSVCRNWREALYHPIWWRNVTFTIEEHQLLKAKYYISAFGSLVAHATIKVDTMSPACVNELSLLLCQLADNDSLKSLVIQPRYCRIEAYQNSQRMDETDMRTLLKYLKLCCRRGLEKFSIGGMEKLACHSHEFLELLALSSTKKMTHLGLASVKDEPGLYKPLNIDKRMFRPFSKLEILSIDYEVLNDNFLVTLDGLVELKRLVVHVNGISSNHMGTTDQAWKRFKVCHPKCELRVTLIHAYEEVGHLESILREQMPLSHLKVFFCEDINVPMLHHISTYYQRTFRSLVWVDSQIKGDNCNSWKIIKQPLLGESPQPDPIVMMAWLCPQLEEIVLLGYKYYEEDLVAIARLRHDTLKVFEVGHDDVLYSCEDFVPYINSRKEVPCLLHKPWAPLKANQLHPVICDATAGDSDEYLMPKVLADLQ